MNTINDKEKIEIGGRTLLVSPLKAAEIRKRIVARLKRDAAISEELRHWNMLPSGYRNQTKSLTGSNYSGNDLIDRRAINSVVRGMVPIIETRFQHTLRREWTA